MPIPQVPSPLTSIIATSTYDSNWFSGNTIEQQIQNAIDRAAADGAARVLVHGPYDATLVTFNTAVKMVLEGEDWANFNIKAYGAAGNGSNATVALNAAIDAAFAAGGGKVFLPIGTYALDAISLKANVEIVGAGRATVLSQASDNYMLQSADFTGAEVALTANAVAGDSAITLSSSDAATLAKGDYCILGSTEAVVNSTTGATYGEWVRVFSVSGTTVNLYGRVQRSYSTANTATVRKVTLLTGVAISNLRLTNPVPGTRTRGAILLRYVYDPQVKNVWIDGFDGRGVELVHVVAGLVDGLWTRDLTDDGTRFGYGVAAFGAHSGLRVNNIHGDKVRHVFTTGGAGSAGAKGIPYGIVVSNSTGRDCTGAAFDTHQEGEGIVFSTCTALGSTGADGSIGPAYGFQFRSPRTKGDGLISRYAKDIGFRISPEATGTVLSNCESTGTQGDGAGGGSGVGFSIGADRCTLNGCSGTQNGRQAVFIPVNVVKTTIANGDFYANNITGGSTGSILLNGNVVDTKIIGTRLADQAIAISFAGAANGVTEVVGCSFPGITTIFSGTIPAVLKVTPGEFVISKTLAAGDSNDYDPAAYADTIRFTGDGAGTSAITGLINGFANRQYVFINVAAPNVTIRNASAGSTAANRFTTTTGADLVLTTNQMAMAVYDANSTRWRVSKLP